MAHLTLTFTSSNIMIQNRKGTASIKFTLIICLMFITASCKKEKRIVPKADTIEIAETPLDTVINGWEF
jgi:hypothetical protein